MTEETKAALVKAITAELPDAVIDGIVSEALMSTLRNFGASYGNSDFKLLTDLVKDVVVARAKEFLRTKYAAEVDKQADILAARVAAELPQMRMRSSP